jgi:signal transduction histidine kinase/DNA-binding response OmpR family regulator
MTNDEKVNILVVDDLPEKLLVLSSILESLGENVVTAKSGREALRRVLDQEFAVILLDVNMPDIDGFETAAMIRGRRQSAHTPIIFVTAFTDEMHSEQGYSLGAVDYIMAPVVPAVLRTKVGVFVDLFRKTRQVRQQAEERIALAQAQAARAAAEEATKRSRFLADASAALAQSLDYRETARALARQVVPFLGELCALTIAGDHGADDWHTELAWFERPGEPILQSSVAGEPPVPALRTLFREVLASGESQFVSNLDPTEFDGATAVPRDGRGGEPRFQPSSVIASPLQARGRTLGVIAVAVQAGDRELSTADWVLANDLASRAAMALDNARLYRDVQENNRRKNEFLAMLAHELRNPLAPIRNAVECSRMLESQSSDQQWANEVIARQVEHLARLVDDLLDISRISGGKIHLRAESVDAASVVSRAVETSRPLIDERQHELTVSLPPEPLPMKCDAVRVAQVLSNLLNNAAKYTAKRGQILLDVEREDRDVVFRVRDNGMGIAALMLPHIFDLFAQADRSLDRSQGGLGIGLTLVRRLVELHGGTVRAFSAGTNRGSEFVVRLPLCETDALIRENNRPNSSPTGTTSSRRVLLVEDLPDVASSLSRLLRRVGHEVTAACDGVSALAALARELPDFVLLDIGLPGMDGYEVAREIRRVPGAELVVVIALTGYGQDDDRARSRAAGFDHHLTKPVDLDALLALLANGRGPSPIDQAARASA